MIDGKGGPENAYFTVEAALVFPVVMGTVLFVIFMLLFQYDRCLLEQDLGAAALWGSSQEVSDVTVLEEMVNERMAGIYRGKYAAWEITEWKASLEKNLFSVQGGGRVTFPVPEWNFWSVENIWAAEAHYSCRRLSPVTFIRLCRGLVRFLDEGEEELADAEAAAER
ncbi:MAG: hypothetical protein NC389_17895 [Acetatifactor muris]|nr:hypothetical protein [Acetatifactor muris]